MSNKLKNLKFATLLLLLAGFLVLGTFSSCRKDGKKDDKTEQVTKEHEEHPSNGAEEHPKKDGDEHAKKDGDEHPKKDGGEHPKKKD